MATPKRHRNMNNLSDVSMPPENDSPILTRRPAISQHQGDYYIPTFATMPYLSRVPESSPPSFDSNKEHRLHLNHTDQSATNQHISNIASTPLPTKTASERPKTAGCIESSTRIISPFPFRSYNLEKGDCESIEETPSKRRMSYGSLRSSNPFSLSSDPSRSDETRATRLVPKPSIISSSPPLVETSIYDKLGWDNDDDPF
jgi:hypothetical protein